VPTAPMYGFKLPVAPYCLAECCSDSLHAGRHAGAAAGDVPLDARNARFGNLLVRARRNEYSSDGLGRRRDSHQRSMIHFVPMTISQTATVAADSTVRAASMAIKRRIPSSSR
jgi:hypothetical protein